MKCKNCVPSLVRLVKILFQIEVISIDDGSPSSSSVWNWNNLKNSKFEKNEFVNSNKSIK